MNRPLLGLISVFMLVVGVFATVALPTLVDDPTLGVSDGAAGGRASFFGSNGLTTRAQFHVLLLVNVCIILLLAADVNLEAEFIRDRIIRLEYEIRCLRFTFAVEPAFSGARYLLSAPDNPAHRHQARDSSRRYSQVIQVAPVDEEAHTNEDQEIDSAECQSGGQGGHDNEPDHS